MDSETKPLAVGDVVQLKSGGPKMTVDRILDSGIHCVWFSEDNLPYVQQYTSQEALVVSVEPTAKPAVAHGTHVAASFHSKK